MKTVSPYTYKGNIHVPRSKSYLQRAIAIAILTPGTTKIKGFTPSSDALAALRIAKSLGADYSIQEDVVTIYELKLKQGKISLNSGEAGLSTRMFSPIASSLYDQVELNGEGSILVRPMDMVIDALEQLGTKVSFNQGKLPLEMEGKI